MTDVRRLRRLSPLVVAALVGGLVLPLTATPASASCTGPQIGPIAGPLVIEAGGPLTLRGSGFIDGCDDTPTPGEEDEPAPGMRDVPLVLHQGGRVYELGRANAGGPGSEHYGRIRWQVTVPEDVVAGRARLTVLSESVRTRVAETPTSTYVAAVRAVRDRDVEGFRALVAGDRVGLEVRATRCSSDTERPGRIVRCLDRAADAQRLQLPAVPDAVLRLRRLARLDHPRASSERLTRITRRYAGELGAYIGEDLRPADVAIAVVDAATQNGTSLDVVLARTDGRWGLAFLETRRRTDARS